jgi:hypothetical protein
MNEQGEIVHSVVGGSNVFMISELHSANVLIAAQPPPTPDTPTPNTENTPVKDEDEYLEYMDDQGNIVRELFSAEPANVSVGSVESEHQLDTQSNLNVSDLRKSLLTLPLEVHPSYATSYHRH